MVRAATDLATPEHGPDRRPRLRIGPVSGLHPGRLLPRQRDEPGKHAGEQDPAEARIQEDGPGTADERDTRAQPEAAHPTPRPQPASGAQRPRRPEDRGATTTRNRRYARRGRTGARARPPRPSSTQERRTSAMIVTTRLAERSDQNTMAVVPI